LRLLPKPFGFISSQSLAMFVCRRSALIAPEDSTVATRRSGLMASALPALKDWPKFILPRCSFHRPKCGIIRNRLVIFRKIRLRWPQKRLFPHGTRIALK
jgi:hypothetical protein